MVYLLLFVKIRIWVYKVVAHRSRTKVLSMYCMWVQATPDAILTLTSKASLTTTISITAPISVSNVQLTILDSETKLSEAG